MQVGGDQREPVVGAAQQRGVHEGAELADGSFIAVGFAHLRELVDEVVGFGGLVGGEVRGQGGAAVGGCGVDPYVRRFA